MATTTTTNKAVLAFTMQEQQEMAWCWAAVGTSTALFFDPSSAWTQCKIVTASLDLPADSCCKQPGGLKCNKTYFLEDPTKTEGSFIEANIANDFQAGAVSFERLMTEINQKRPVAFRMELEMMGEKMYHFVVVIGYESLSDQQMVTINDPFFGSSVMPYGEFTQKYQGNGSVTHSFFTKPMPTT
ncbi:MAG: C39 family peptidase [Saprospiraceae bacterium]|nr:C39 family peptidase [Saprospiraceae bacterium]